MGQEDEQDMEVNASHPEVPLQAVRHCLPVVYILGIKEKKMYKLDRDLF